MLCTDTSIADNTSNTTTTSQNPYGKRTHKPLQVGDDLNTNDGPVVVFSYINAKQVQVVFIDTLTVGTFSASHLRSGKVKDYASPSVYGIGFLGEGPHQSHINSQITRVGLLWRNCLKRCYDTPVQASYSSTTVSTEFHNFQGFAEWFDKQENRDLLGLDLDKDLRPFLRREVQSAPQYSPANCALVPADLNLKLAKLQRKLKKLKAARTVHPAHAALPVGMNFDKSHLNFRVYVNGELVGSRRRLGGALDLYEKANIQAFIADVESYKSSLSTEVQSEFEAYKLRFQEQFQLKSNAQESQLATI